MKDRLVLHATALAAKKKGFDWWCPNAYIDGKVRPTNSYDKDHIFAPSQTLLQKWLRDTQGVFLWCTMNNLSPAFGRDWVHNILIYRKGKLVYETKEIGGLYTSYEQSLELGLQESIDQLEDVE